MTSEECTVGSIGGDVMVEVMDLHDIATLEPEFQDHPLPKEKMYAKVSILPSGWVRCADPADDRSSDQPGTSTDYYPPERVNGIFTIEQSEGADE